MRNITIAGILVASSFTYSSLLFSQTDTSHVVVERITQLVLGDSDTVRVNRREFEAQLDLIQTWTRTNRESFEYSSDSTGGYPYERTAILERLFADSSSYTIRRSELQNLVQRYRSWQTLVAARSDFYDQIVVKTVGQLEFEQPEVERDLKCYAQAFHAVFVASAIVDTLAIWKVGEALKINEWSRDMRRVRRGSVSNLLEQLRRAIHGLGRTATVACAPSAYIQRVSILADSALSRFSHDYVNNSTDPYLLLSDSVKQGFKEVITSLGARSQDIEETTEKINALLHRVSLYPKGLTTRHRILSLIFSIEPSVIYNDEWLGSRGSLLREWLQSADLNRAVELDTILPRSNGGFDVALVVQSPNQKVDGRQLLAYIREQVSERLFWKTVNLLGTAPDRLRIHLWADCASLSLYYAQGDIQQGGFACMSGYAEANIDFIDRSLLQRAVTQPSRISVVSNQPDFSQLLYAAVIEQLRIRGVSVERQVQRIKVDNNQVIFRIENLRSEVIRNESYWENIQFILRIRRSPSGSITLACITDGQFGTGIVVGPLNRPPAYHDYRNMEPRFSRQLQSYTSEFLQRIRDTLRSR
jgi:hypothetical protein